MSADEGGPAFFAWYGNGKLWFTTKVTTGSGRSTCKLPDDQQGDLRRQHVANPVLTGVDNIVGAASGDLFVAEDGGNMEPC